MSQFLPIQLSAGQKFITIGTGGVTGTYYTVGGAICQLVNKDRRRHGLRCSVEATAASVYNLRAVRAHDLDFGLAQSGMHHAAYTGTGVFVGEGSDKDLRSLFSIHYEVVTVVARRDSGAKRFEDLRGKRFNIGVVGAGTRVGAEKLIAGMGLTASDFEQLTELKPDAHAQALCENRIDAYLYMIGHPTQNIVDATNRCDAVILPLTGPKIDRMFRENPYYVRYTIPGGMYRGNPHPIPTYAVRATLTSSARTSPEIVYQVVKAVFENFDRFVTMHPAFAGLNLDPKEMIKNGITAPLHEGAIRYYKERGWL